MQSPSKITVLATENNNSPIYLKTSWEGQIAHVVRKNGILRRCKIGKLNISDGEVAIFVEFREKLPKSQDITWVKNSVSPIHLLCANEHWKMATAVSEDEDDVNGCPGRDFDDREQASLPWFECFDTSTLNATERRKLNWMIKQVNNLQCLSQRNLPCDDMGD